MEIKIIFELSTKLQTYPFGELKEWLYEKYDEKGLHQIKQRISDLYVIPAC